MENFILSLIGTDGQVLLYKDRVLIKREGFMAFLAYGPLRGDKTLYLSQITGVHIKSASMFLNGYIEFLSPERFDTKTEENKILFEKSSNDIAHEIKEKIDELKHEYSVPLQQTSTADEIRKYKALLDDGLIAQEEYEAKKKQLLGL
jgi:hypothetical protein